MIIPNITIDAWISENITAAGLAFPLTTSTMQITEDMQDVPPRANEYRNPILFRIRKKTVIINTKKKADRKNRNFAKLLVKESLPSYFLNSLPSKTSEKDIRVLPGSSNNSVCVIP